MPADVVPDNPEARRGLIGAIVRRNLPAGQAFIPADVLRPGDHGFLAAVLGPNQRAITVGVDVVSGTAGLIWPGDKVDLILTQSLEDPTRPLGRRVAAETVLADVRVIAIDQQLFQGAAPNSAADAPTARTVTLEVSASQAERVSVATRLGRLSLVVRSAERSAEPDAPPVRPGITWAGDVSPALGGSNAETPPNIMRIFQGQTEGKEFRF
ncbi:Flp pilus assembly protein CpaB [Siccirubricoccus deserti]